MRHEPVRIGIRELRRDLSGYLHRVENGQSVTVTSRDRVVAEIVPPRLADGPLPHWGRGALKGKLRIADDFDDWPNGVLDAMLDSPVVPPDAP